MLYRLFGVALILISVAAYPLIAAIAVSAYLSIGEKAIFSSIVYGVSWISFLLGIYFAGPELVAKLKMIYKNLKNKLFNKKIYHESE